MQDGFILSNHDSKIDNLAFISLRISIKAYFETYNCFKWNLNVVVNENSKVNVVNSSYNSNYFEYSTAAILNFHHFAELIIKDILSKEHKLLAIDASRNPQILYRLINNIHVDSKEFENLKLLEFSDAIDRLKVLGENNYIDKTKYQFVLDAITWLKILNKIRNRIIHRGMFIIRYKALDYLFGKYILPFVQKTVSLPEYSNNNYWKFGNLDSEIDPINEIVDSFNSRKYELYKLALLKELGRAAYVNPIKHYSIFFKSLHQSEIRKYEGFAKSAIATDYAYETQKCPVCGINSLVLYTDTVDNEDELGNILSHIEYIYSLKCFCCSFELNNDIEQIEKMNLNIQNYFKEV